MEPQITVGYAPAPASGPGRASAARAELCRPPVQAAALSGSYARGRADTHSALDLMCYVPSSAPTREWLGYRGGLLVSIDHQHAGACHRDLTHPESAVRAVMPLRHLKALHDPEGVVAGLQRAALAFEWSQVARLGRAFAAELVTHQAEVIHKLLGGLARGETARTSAATTEVAGAMLVAVAVWRGVLVDSGNTYAAQVWEEVGTDSAWSRWHRMATGAEGVSSLRDRALAALALYEITAQGIEAELSGEAAAVVTEVRRCIQTAGHGSGRPAT